VTKSREESKAKGWGAKEPYNVLYDAFVDAGHNFLAVVALGSEDFVDLRVKQRAYGDWLGIAKRYGPDGGLEVCFGTGHDFVSALLGLNGAMAANRWKPDKPWAPGE